MSDDTKVNRAEIAAMVGPDFDYLQSGINHNLTKQEISDAWDTELQRLWIERVVALGLTTDEAKRFLAIYLEEQDAMIARRVQQVTLSQQRQRAVSTAAASSFWTTIFQIFG